MALINWEEMWKHPSGGVSYKTDLSSQLWQVIKYVKVTFKVYKMNCDTQE